MLWEISLLIIAVAILLAVIFAIPAILQFRRTTKNLDLTVKTLNQNLPGILTNIDEITTGLTDTVHTISEQTEGLKEVISKFQGMADDVVSFERQIRQEIESPILETVSTIGALVKGIRVFIDALRYRK
jgi:uncharacterized protein YoxC